MSACHVVHDEECKHPANAIGSRCTTTCHACGDFVCTSAGCSTIMTWYGRPRVRVCRGCREDQERIEADQRAALARAPKTRPCVLDDACDGTMHLKPRLDAWECPKCGTVAGPASSSSYRATPVKSEEMAKTRIPFTIAMREALITARDTLGISQSELAINRCGLKTLGTLSGLERGRIHSIERALLKKLEDALGVKFNVPIGKPSGTMPKRSRSRPSEAEVSAYTTSSAMETLAGQMSVGELARLAGCTVGDLIERVLADKLAAEMG